MNSLITDSELEIRAQAAGRLLSSCRLCPRQCRVNRLKGEKGFCRGGRLPKVASCNSHFGEEPPISGTRGSGTVFFSGCTLRCFFCQNYPISQFREGNEVGIPELARMFLELQARKCHNINLVTPTHFMPQILAALRQARSEGFNLPLVYNTSGYEKPEMLKFLDGVVDIYLPDLKYGDDAAGAEISGAGDYFSAAGPALREMFRQAGLLDVDEKGVARRGMIVRHLVLPDNLSATEKVLEFIAREISVDTTVSLMAQYFPAHRALTYPQLNRRVGRKEYAGMVKLAQRLSLHNLFIQEISDN